MGSFILRPAAVASTSSNFWAGFNTTFAPADYKNTDAARLQAINSIINGRFLTLGGLMVPVPINTYIIRFMAGISDAVWELDGNPPVSFNSLPAGFLITSAILSLSKDTSVAPLVGRYIDDAFASLFISFDSIHEIQIPNPSVIGGPTGNFPYPLSLVALNILSGGTGIRLVTGTLDATFACRDLHIAGAYTIQSSQFTLQNTDPVSVGDKVKISSATGGLDGIKEIKLDYTDPVLGPKTIIIDAPSWYIILWEIDQFWFYLPYGFGSFTGNVTITLVGNGTQFSGSVVVGTLTVLFADASGIYQLTNGQTNDVLYFKAGQLTNPQQLFLQLEDDPTDSPAVIVEEDSDFYSMLGYPTAALSSVENYEVEDFSIIGIQQQVVITKSVEIPSPFAVSAFLP